MSLLRALNQAGALRTLDDALAQSLRRLQPDSHDWVLAAAALASLAVSQGHAGFDPARPQALIDAPLPWPAADEWTQVLAASRWVATPGPDQANDETAADAVLVLEPASSAGALVYLRRYREYERDLARQLQRIGRQQASADVEAAALAPLFAQLFADPGDAAGGSLETNRQARAAAAALNQHLLLITGGPGTGKTTTITRLLVLLLAQARQQAQPAPRIALAAPTGRAAERMAQSVRAAVAGLQAKGVDPSLFTALPASGTTLHRLLGTMADSPRFRHDVDHPLPFDIVVVDEASMIDLPMMAKLVDAVPTGARLILLGDPDQLPSVEAGDVLSGILRAAGDGSHLSRTDAGNLQALGGQVVSKAAISDEDVGRGFAGAHVHLQKGYRQHQALQLSALAGAVREGNCEHALSLLRGGDLSGVHFHEDVLDPLLARRESLLAHWQALADAGDPAQALAQANRLRLLTAVRDGPQGARGLNARIEELLQSGSAGHPRSGTDAHFHGRLLLITENSYRHRLFNGDIGICLRDADGVLAAWFAGDAGPAPRAFHPAALPAHESAFAMTVHKSQGSEFDEVWLQLPARFNRVLSRELIYTGLTRARQQLHLAASAGILEAALSRHASRLSGLGWRLQACG
ncbi:exodeoxyribonuclease V subunit alpha [Pseudoxanthomonas dokdonensis]|uniref:RecBCD enzyme subunit RecD n=1 Tax=Pseudoxanthomonas dokdonensis TaxID=344882 RepID=A0A0R0CF90_9GAMM|nr:exodeoxyribonuclease V subunit alpha [Pseudoxanthomonas dokdonensis]KRG68476.1 exodeoxyribonuclease V subunit alpha [Pseudoxanthomonas dokdonensis]